jgi:hypothetical protein
MKNPPVSAPRAITTRRTFSALLLLALAVAPLGGCERKSNSYGDININSKLEAADGLDLKAVGELVKKAKDAEGFETLLNKEGGVNNLDLDGDGKVDFIKVTEFGNDETKGFSLTVEPVKGEIQEIATIEIQKKAEQAEVDVRGNQQIYGTQRHHYHYGTSLGSMMLMGYLFRPHPYYMSPFHFGYYPRYYGFGYARIGHTAYLSRTRTITRSSSARSVSRGRPSRISSPNKGRSASRGIRTNLRNPTKSQRSFRASSRRPTSKGGFASRTRNRGTSKRTRSPSRGFGRSRSRGGFRSRGFRSRR